MLARLQRERPCPSAARRPLVDVEPVHGDEEHRKSEEEARNSRASAAEAAAPRVAKPSAFGYGRREVRRVLQNRVRGGEDGGGKARLPQGVLPLRRVYLQQEADLRLQHGGRPALLLAALQQAPEEAKEPTSSRGDGNAVAAAARRRRAAAGPGRRPPARRRRRPHRHPKNRRRRPRRRRRRRASAAAARSAPSAARPSTPRSVWARREWSFTRSASAARSAM